MRATSAIVMSSWLLLLGGCSAYDWATGKGDSQQPEPPAAQAESTPAAQTSLVTERSVPGTPQEVWNGLARQLNSAPVSLVYESPTNAMVVLYDGSPSNYVACTDDSNNPEVDPTYRLIARSIITLTPSLENTTQVSTETAYVMTRTQKGYGRRPKKKLQAIGFHDDGSAKFPGYIDCKATGSFEAMLLRT